RPNRVSGTDPLLFQGGSFDPATDRYLNAAAFSQPAAFTIGNSSRLLSDARSFPSYNENFSIIKRTYITETVNLEFRAEFFNAFNRVVFGNPNGDFNFLPGFGQIGYQANAPRQIQFGLKFNF
ncbi:MAG TPA: hypothetical protein VFQ43_13420, partial [Nitrososphaera sp.]|nr:hypothetical protein [Nitrososphaera sp.]